MPAINKAQTSQVAQKPSGPAAKQAKEPKVAAPKKAGQLKDAKKIKLSFKVGLVILGLINLAFIVVTGFTLKDLRARAVELRELRGIGAEGITAPQVAAIRKEMAATRQKVDKLSDLFADDDALVRFVKEIDKLKTDGVVTDFSFASNDVVRDKTGSSGLPVAIVFQGSWADIDRDLRKLQGLSFLQRAIKVEISRLPEDLIEFRYGGFLYVKEEENK
jgi:hypothetical protein